MPIFTVDATGVHAPSLDESLANKRQQMADIFGDDLSNADQTPQGQLAGIIALVEVVVGEALVNLGAATDPDNAVGTQLDQLYGLLDLLRQVASRSRVTTTVTGTAGTGLPIGSRAKTADGAEFRTTEAVIIAPSPGVMVDMESVEEGPIEAAAGALTQIVTVVPGWETITNTEAALMGTARQTDPAYRATSRQRTAQRSVGSLSSLESALSVALAGKFRAVENFTNAQTIVQEWAIDPHHILTVALSGTDGDIRRAVENYRGMGVGTMIGIVGGTPNNTTLDSVTNGTVNWNGVDYTGLDLSTANTDELKAAALSTLLVGTGVTVRAVDGVYIAMLGWQPNVSPTFGTGTVETNFGLAPAVSTYPAGPYARTRTRDLTIDLTVERQAGFPGDGLDQIRAAVNSVVAGYGVGQEAWLNDFTAAVEGVLGTRIMVLTVEYNSIAASGVDVPLDAVWALPSANLSVTIT